MEFNLHQGSALSSSTSSPPAFGLSVLLGSPKTNSHISTMTKKRLLDSLLQSPYPLSPPDDGSPNQETSPFHLLLSTPRASSRDTLPRASPYEGIPPGLVATAGAAAQSTKSVLKKSKSLSSMTLSKSVRFDKHDLKQVCMFANEGRPLDINTSPRLHMKDLGDGTKDQLRSAPTPSSPPFLGFGANLKSTAFFDSAPQQQSRILRTNVPFFPAPLSVSGKQIQVESITLDALTRSLRGTLRVRNLAFEKRVWIRYTTDHWRSYADLDARYLQSCSTPDLPQDQFTFDLVLSQVFPGDMNVAGRSLEFAAQYQVLGSVYWDNHEGLNYDVHFG